MAWQWHDGGRLADESRIYNYDSSLNAWIGLGGRVVEQRYR